MLIAIWKPVQGYERFYIISCFGQIRSLDRIIPLANGRQRKIKGKTLIPIINKNGYLFVSLSKNGINKTRYIHRLVAEAFIPNHFELPEVNHLNGNKADNTLENLQWVSHRDNVQHAYDNDLTTNKGGTHHFAVGIIDNELNRQFSTVKEWCIARGIPYSTGRNILNGKQNSRRINLGRIIKIGKTVNNE